MLRYASIGVSIVVAILAGGCYRPRIESCRDPITNFAWFSNLTIAGAVADPGGREGGGLDFAVEYTLSAATTERVSRGACVEVHSELRDATGHVLEVIDTPVASGIASGMLTTSPIYHYRSGAFPLTLSVTALGQTVTTLVQSPFAPIDAGRADAGP